MFSPALGRLCHDAPTSLSAEEARALVGLGLLLNPGALASSAIHLNFIAGFEALPTICNSFWRKVNSLMQRRPDCRIRTTESKMDGREGFSGETRKLVQEFEFL
jgi:hypothetical protein